MGAYRGWVVLRSGRGDREVEVERCATEEAARALVRRLNSAAGADLDRPLYWAEYWSTTSSLNHERWFREKEKSRA